MRFVSKASSTWALLLLTLTACGCSRQKYRLQADQEAYQTIAERNVDPRWSAHNVGIDLDPRSRYFDTYDPDHSPMPLDDPASHQYIHAVNGIKGWKHWHKYGERLDLENPGWREGLPLYVESTPEGAIKLDVESAVQLAYVHSPNHQRQLETLYLSSLDVTAERFRLDTQFFGGYDTNYLHQGSLSPPFLAFNPTFQRFVVTPAVDGVENNLLTLGRPAIGNPALQMRKRFATAGELLVGFANSFVFEFTGGDANLSASLANFSLMQPLLRGAGKDVALEQLTQQERTLLANLRAYSQFRQGFYTNVAIGDLGVNGPQRFGSSTVLRSFAGGAANRGGYLGLLQQRQQVRISRENLSLQVRTRDRFQALYDNELTTLVQVDQIRQGVQRQRSTLLGQQNNLELALDTYKTQTLGLPPDLEIELDESLIRQFQLLPDEADPIQDSLLELQGRLSEFPDEADVDAITKVLIECSTYVEPVKQLFETARRDLAGMERIVPSREKSMTEEDRGQFRDDRERLYTRLADLETGELGYDVAVAKLKALREGATEETRKETIRGAISWVGSFLQIVERLSLVPAQARLEMITVEAIDLTAEDAFQVALQNRLDFMNGRAALVDRWRAVQVSADALQSVLNLTASGDMRTARNNPVSFRAPTGSFRLGLEFDAPFTRLLERNAYRESLIEYQRSRRDFIQSRDGLHLGLRALLRNLRQLRQNLEIQRRAVTIALRQVDQTQLDLTQPRPPAEPGARSPIDTALAFTLQNAQQSLQQSQTDFLNAWLNYYATRMTLYRELGIMMLDPQGQWIEYPIEGGDAPAEELPEPQALPMPPVVSATVIDLVGHTERQSSGSSTSMVTPATYATPVRRGRIRRLPPTE